MKWNEVIDKDHINSDLIGDIGTEKVVTITKVVKDEEYYSQQTNKKEKGLGIHFAECKPLICNVTNATTLMNLFGGAEADTSNAVGKKITLYVTQTKVAGKPKNCIRIKEYSAEKCEECGNEIRPAASRSVAQLIEISKRNTGKKLCLSCMQAYAKKKEESNESVSN